MSRSPRVGGLRQTGRRPVRRAILRGRSIVKITEDARKYAAEQELSEADALQAGMEQKSKEFAGAGAEIYSKA
jgi:hypothetical protein